MLCAVLLKTQAVWHFGEKLSFLSHTLDTIDMMSSCLSYPNRYLDLRGICNGVGPVLWPSSYDPAERDQAYKSFSLSGWAGRSGHDAPMIALDALLGAGSNWEELMNRAGFHGGQRSKHKYVPENVCSDIFYHYGSLLSILLAYVRNWLCRFFRDV